MSFIFLPFFLLIAFVFLFATGPIFANKKYKKAISFEQNKDYKSACYAYAIAILNGCIMSKSCRRKIKFLWEEYGPFDYSDVLKKLELEGDTPEGCEAAGHAATISIIDEIVSENKK